MLERGALLEHESGAPAALAYLRGGRLHGARLRLAPALLSTIADLAVKTQDKARALKALEALIAIPASRGDALLKKGDFLETLGQGDAAERVFEEAAREDDPDVSVKATLRLARGAERTRNVLRATTLYEEILLKAPVSPQADQARLGLAALYGSAGRLADARRLYEEILRNAAPSSDVHKAAEAGMKALEGASAVENRG